MKIYKAIDSIAGYFLDGWWCGGEWRDIKWYLRKGIIDMANDYIATYRDYEETFNEDENELTFSIPNNPKLFNLKYDEDERILTLTFHSETRRNYYPSIRRFFNILKHRGVKVTKEKIKNEEIGGYDRIYKAVEPMTIKEIRKLRRKSVFWDDMGFDPI